MTFLAGLFNTKGRGSDPDDLCGRIWKKDDVEHVWSWSVKNNGETERYAARVEQLPGITCGNKGPSGSFSDEVE